MKHVFCFISLILFVSCGVQTQYVGKSYTPTLKTDIYMGWNEVVGNYETIGYVDATPSGFNTIEDAQKKIEELAKAKGADAIVFDGVEIGYTPPVLETTEKVEKNTDGGYTKVVTTTNTTEPIKTLKATLIKYKR